MSDRPRLALRIGSSIQVTDPGRISPCVQRWFLRGPFAACFRFVFRPRFTGWEHLPKDRPVLMVSNHSGGGGIEIIALSMLWNEEFGDTRRVTGLAHPIAWYLPGPAQTVQALGAVPSTYEHGITVLEQGIPTIIFPGGDHDAFRPVWQAKLVDFNGRKGFLKLARRAWVPIVPMGIHGSHYTAPSLWRSKLLPYLFILPRLLGLKRFPLTLFAVIGATTLLSFGSPSWGWGWAILWAALWCISPFAVFFPIVPWPIRVRMGELIEPEALFGERGEEGPLDQAYERVVAAVQAQVLAAAKD